MAHEIRFTLNIEIDGQSLPNMPVVRRYADNEANTIAQVQGPDNNTSSFHGIAAATMAALGIFYLATDQALNLNLNQLAALPLNANGLILILGTNLTQATPSNNVTVNNPAVATSANITGLVAGT
jgi:hypothetical protein